MPRKSAGILLYHFRAGILEVILAHPGGPFYKHKDVGVWTIPKGEMEGEEEGLAAAIREFKEETGVYLQGNFAPLRPIQQKGGKTVFCWAHKGELDVANMESNTFQLEWPPNSGRMQEFSEIDKVAWFTLPKAKKKIIPAQAALLDELAGIVNQPNMGL